MNVSLGAASPLFMLFVQNPITVWKPIADGVRSRSRSPSAALRHLFDCASEIAGEGSLAESPPSPWLLTRMANGSLKFTLFQLGREWLIQEVERRPALMDGEASPTKLLASEG